MSSEYRETLLVILGAGASHDCLPYDHATPDSVVIDGLPPMTLDEARPPLTQHLASALPLTNWVLGRWPWARPAVDHLRRALTTPRREGASQALTLERALSTYENTADSLPERQRHLLAVRFYLRDVLWACTSYMMAPEVSGGVSNYLPLIAQAREWAGRQNGRVVFVSFNYDLLLERALESTWQFNPSQLSDYVENDYIHVLKPHGSIQWHWPIIGGGALIRTDDPLRWGAESIQAALDTDVDTRRLTTVPWASHEYWQADVAHQTLIPAIALPTDAKNDESFVWPKEQAALMQSLQGTVTRVITIGWRGLEPHFLDLLRPLVKHGARIAICTGGEGADTEAGQVINRLRKHLNVAPTAWKTHCDGFKNLVTESETLGWILEPDSSARS